MTGRISYRCVRYPACREWVDFVGELCDKCKENGTLFEEMRK